MSRLSWWRHQMETFSSLLAICTGNSPVTSEFPHIGQWHGTLIFSLIRAWIKGRVNNREAGDLERQHAHHDVTVIIMKTPRDHLIYFSVEHQLLENELRSLRLFSPSLPLDQKYCDRQLNDKVRTLKPFPHYLPFGRESISHTGPFPHKGSLVRSLNVLSTVIPNKLLMLSWTTSINNQNLMESNLWKHITFDISSGNLRLVK